MAAKQLREEGDTCLGCRVTSDCSGVNLLGPIMPTNEGDQLEEGHARLQQAQRLFHGWASVTATRDFPKPRSRGRN